MGNYTGYKIDVALRADTPPQILAVLQWLIASGDDEPAPSTPDHPFFQTARWASILAGGSSYFDYGIGASEDLGKATLTRGDDGTWQLKSYSSSKGYEDDLPLFLQWLLPHFQIDSTEPTLVGQALYEESSQPLCVIYLGDALNATRQCLSPDPDDDWFGSATYNNESSGKHTFTQTGDLLQADWDLPKMLRCSSVYTRDTVNPQTEWY